MPCIGPQDFGIIDYRYFYDEDGIGYYTCGIARDAVSTVFLEYDTVFVDKDYLGSIDKFIDNASTVRPWSGQSTIQPIPTHKFGVWSGVWSLTDSIEERAVELEMGITWDAMFSVKTKTMLVLVWGIYTEL